MSIARTIFAAALLGAVFCGPMAGSASADDAGVRPAKHRLHHSAARVKGFVARSGGGYSYAAGDSINTYGDSRSKYGGVSSLRDPMYDRQTASGPFDHGFFFDSGMGLHGGDSPYLH